MDIKDRVYTMEEMEVRMEKLMEMSEKVDALLDLDVSERLRGIEKRFDAELKFLLSAHNTKADAATLQSFLTALQKINPAFVDLGKKTFFPAASGADAKAAATAGTVKLPRAVRRSQAAAEASNAAAFGSSTAGHSGGGVSPRRKTLGATAQAKTQMQLSTELANLSGGGSGGSGSGGVDSGAPDLSSLFTLVHSKANSEDILRLEQLVRSMDKNMRAVTARHRDSIQEMKIAMKLIDANGNPITPDSVEPPKPPPAPAPGTSLLAAAAQAQAQAQAATNTTAGSGGASSSTAAAADEAERARLPASVRFKYTLPGPFDRYARLINGAMSDLKQYVMTSVHDTSEKTDLNKLAIDRMRDTVHAFDKTLLEWKANPASAIVVSSSASSSSSAPPPAPAAGGGGGGGGAPQSSTTGSDGTAKSVPSALDAANSLALYANEINPVRFRQLHDTSLQLTESLARVQTLVLHHSTQLNQHRDWIGKNTKDLHALRDWLKHAQRILADTASKTQATELLVHMIKQIEEELSTLKQEMGTKASASDVESLPLRDISPEDLQRLIAFITSTDFVPIVSSKPLSGPPSKCMSCDRPLKLTQFMGAAAGAGIGGGGAGGLALAGPPGVGGNGLPRGMPISRSSVAPGGGLFGSAARKTAQLILAQQHQNAFMERQQQAKVEIDHSAIKQERERDPPPPSAPQHQQPPNSVIIAITPAVPPKPAGTAAPVPIAPTRSEFDPPSNLVVTTSAASSGASGGGDSGGAAGNGGGTTTIAASAVVFRPQPPVRSVPQLPLTAASTGPAAATTSGGASQSARRPAKPKPKPTPFQPATARKAAAPPTSTAAPAPVAVVSVEAAAPKPAPAPALLQAAPPGVVISTPQPITKPTHTKSNSSASIGSLLVAAATVQAATKREQQQPPIPTLGGGGGGAATASTASTASTAPPPVAVTGSKPPPQPQS